MSLETILTSLTLLLVANGAPIAAWKLFGARLSHALDQGLCLPDRRRILGPSKTYRGAVASVVATAAAAPLLGLSPALGAWVGVLAMLGDLLSSLVKRRLAIKPSDQALLLDQVPEALLPLLALRGPLDLNSMAVGILVLAFVALELLLSRLLYRFHLRKRPY